MNAQAKLMAGLIFLAVIALLVFGLYHYAEKSGYERRVTEDNKAIAKATKQNDDLKLILQLERQNAENALNVLLARKPERVLMPTCPDQTNPTGGSAVPATGTQRASDLAQEAFDRFADGLELDAVAWSRAIEACRVTMDWAR